MTREPELPAFLGRYAVTRRLGAGGMAEVFLARSRGAEGVDKQLVVKRILPAFAENPHFRAMFIEEARVALRLNHPNVVQVYGFESDGATLLLIMEHVDGPDLGFLAGAARAASIPLDAPLAAYIVREVARGLHYAHERSDEHEIGMEVVHRDVFPSNVLLTFDGAVKIGDFGIAKVRSASSTSHDGVKGKFGYMAPEQSRGEAVDRRADVYSLGSLLTELLSGKALFHGVAQGADILEKLRHNEVPSVALALPDAPAELRDIAARALSADRSLRFATAREISQALGDWLHALSRPADASTLEQFIANVHPRPRVSSRAPSALTASLAAGQVSAPGVFAPEDTAELSDPLLTVAAGSRANAPAMVRDRVHVAVLAGRVIAPATTQNTVDLRPLLGLIDALAFKSDGQLEVHHDDRFTVVLGVIRPRVDDALRAARLSLDILDAARAMAMDLTAYDAGGLDSSPGIAMGLARGMAACTRDADGALTSFEMVDAVVSVSAALADAARAGEVLVATGLHRVVRRGFVLQEQGPRSSAVRGFVLERRKTRAERDRAAEVHATGLSGRESALAELREHLAGVVARAHGRSVLVTGELGVGKSALLEAFVTGLNAPPEGTQGNRAPGPRALRIDGAFAVSGSALVLFGHIVRQLVALQVGQSGVSKLMETLAEECYSSAQSRRAALKTLRASIGLEPQTAEREPPSAREIASLTRRILAWAARPGPLVVLVDSPELLYGPGRAVLADLVRRPAVAPVLVVVALRDDDAMLNDLSGVPAVALRGIDAEARRRLLANAFGAEDASEELVREVSSVAGGNPLMIHEVVDALTERERVGLRVLQGRSVAVLIPAREGELPLPASLEEVLAARFESLSPEGRALLRWCALLDADMTSELVDALGGEQGARLRQRLLSDGILVELRDERARGGRLAFAHPAMASVAMASIDPTAVVAMHARVAECLERLPMARGTGAAALARHREEAGADRPAARAWFEAASAWRVKSREVEALSAYGKVIALCETASDGEGLALRFGAHAGREDIARAAGKTMMRRAELHALRALAVEAREPRLQGSALARQARYRLETSAGEGVVGDVAQAVRAARRSGDARTEAEARRVLAVFYGTQGRIEDALAEIEGALTALDQRGAHTAPPGGSADDGVNAAHAMRVEVLLARAMLLGQAGYSDEAFGTTVRAFGFASRYGTRRLMAAVYNELGRGCLSRGEPGDALRLFLAALAIERELRVREGIGNTAANVGRALAGVGLRDRALGFLRRALNVMGAGRQGLLGVIEARVAIAELLVEGGDTEGAAAEMDQARAAAGASGARAAALVSLGDAVVLIAQRRYRMARVAAEAAEAGARDTGSAAVGTYARALGALSAAQLGDRAGAKRSVEGILSDPGTQGWKIERGGRVAATCEAVLRVLAEATEVGPRLPRQSATTWQGLEPEERKT